MDEKNYKISGMTCAACAATIEMVVNDLPQVAKATVNLATERMIVVPTDEAFDSAQVLEAVSEAGYQAEEKQARTQADFEADLAGRQAVYRALLKRTLLASVFTLPLLYISMGSMVGLPLPALVDSSQVPLNFAILQLCLTLPVMWIGRGFYTRGFRNLLRRHPNMDSLIAVGTGAAFIYGLYAIYHISQGHAHFAHHLYFESVGVIITLILLGKTLEARAKGKTSQAIERLMNLSPKQATVIRYGEVVEIDTEDIRVGDIVRVKPGESVPVDGVVKQGSTRIDESMVTGESLPVPKQIGDTVMSATINQNGTIDYEATRVGQDTTLAQIIKLVETAQGTKAPIAALADKISLYFVPAVIVLASLASLAWFFLGGQSLEFSLQIFISVLIIACPCALGLATPTAIMVGTGKGAEQGILIKSGQVLETSHLVEAVVLDKTGTITEGRPQVTDLIAFNQWSADEVLRLVASGEQTSEHPLASAILEEAEKKALKLEAIDNFQAISGRGLVATCQNQVLSIGNEQLMQEQAVNYEQASAQAETLAHSAKTPIYVALGQQLIGLVAVADKIKPTSRDAIKRLQKQGLQVVMLTGDRQETAQAIANEVGVNHVESQLLPADKVKIVEALQTEGYRVAMVGDGINDAPALVQADVGIAIGSGTDVAIESADIVLMHGDLMDVPQAIQLSRATMRNIKENLFWAFAYNVLGIPIAMGILYLFGGPLLDPMLAGLAMSLSSVSVLLNALRLRYFKFKN